MKKFFAFAGLMTAAVISLTNCQTRELGTEILPGKTFTITASTQIDTKTTNDGMSTLWEAEDTVNVFYGSTAAKGTVVNGANTTQANFEIDGTAPTSAQDWVVFFPYNKHMESPDGSTGYNYVGHSKGLNQAGFNSMASLRGNVCPMYGVAKGQTVDEALITMKQLTSVIELNIKNSTGTAITVSSVTVTASEDIVGSYYFKLDGDEPEYIPRGDSYVNNAATVNLTEGGDLAAGASGKVYLPIKPYTQNSSQAFRVTVKATVGGAEKSANIELHPTGAQAVFTAGKIKKVNVDLSSFGEDPGTAIADIHSGTATGSVKVKNVVVTSVFPKGFFVSDGKDILYVYVNAAPDVAKNAKVTVEGTVSIYKGNKQISNPTVTANGTGSVTMTPASWKGSNVEAAYTDNNTAYVTLEMNATSTTMAGVDGTNTILYFPSAQKGDGVNISKDKTYTVVGYIYGHAKYGEDQEVYIYIESANEKITSATLTVSPTSVNIDQAGGTAEATVTCDNANWTIDNPAEWLTATKSGDKITFSASANTETKRSATVTINHSNGELKATVKVSQEGEVETETLTLGAASVSFTEEGGEKEVSVTCNASADWSIDSSTVPDWITATADKENKKIILVAQANTGGAREGTIVVNHSNGEISRNLAVSQAAKSTGGKVTYTKVNSIVDGGQYLIVTTYEKDSSTYNRAFNGGLSTLDAANNFVEVTVNGNSITTDKDCYFIYNASEGSFKSASGVYVAAKGTSDANGMTSPTEYAESVCRMTVTFDGYDVNIVAPSTSVLRYNSTSGQDRFRFYKSTTYTAQQAIQLYKKQ